MAMQMKAFMVQVPPGVAPGQQFHANIGGQLVAVAVPPGVGPGTSLQIQVPVMVQPQPQMVQQQQMRPAAQPPPRAAQQQQPKQLTMNEEEELKQKREKALKERQEAQEKALKEANSATHQIETRQQAREDKANARSNPKSHVAPMYKQNRGPHGLGGATAGPGEVSALWWLNMGL